MRTINIGAQGFEELAGNGCFYVDKTLFIKEWWEEADTVTLITRPRRFGKTLNMDMLNCFFSNRYDDRSDLFERFNIWKEEKYCDLQGRYPVIFLSLAQVREPSIQKSLEMIREVIQQLYRQYDSVLDLDRLGETTKRKFVKYENELSDVETSFSINFLCEVLHKYYGRKVILLIDEYDTPLQEAYVSGYWDEMMTFMRSLFNSTLKTNPFMEKALLTGVTRISKESIFSDLNNINVVTTSSRQYETAFGFTEQEVMEALEEYGLTDKRDQVRDWYDGFIFGRRTDIYNPWSITNYLKKREFSSYWADTSSNSLISNLLQKGGADIKENMLELMKGGTVRSAIDEEIVFGDLDRGASESVWSLMLASGYLKYLSREAGDDEFAPDIYTLAVTNGETQRMFGAMVRRWFSPAGSSNDAFVKAMISGDVDAMNYYLNDIALTTISSFDSGKEPSEIRRPENFYHGFVLGLLVRERSRYTIRSNRESGFGRYDICMYPEKSDLPGIVMEFKVQNRSAGEKTLADTADRALRQIQEKQYAADLEAHGAEQVLLYGFAFSGKHLLIKKLTAGAPADTKDFNDSENR